MNHRRRLPFLMIVAGLWLVADQATKYLAFRHLTEAAPGAYLAADRPYVVKPAVALFESWWHFRYVENGEGAFGLLGSLNPSIRLPLFYATGALAVAIFVVWYFRTDPRLRLRRWGLATVLGGALGNFTDRVRLQRVVDFILWHVGDHFYWPTFNIADAALVIGVGLSLVEELRPLRPDAAAALSPGMSTRDGLVG